MKDYTNYYGNSKDKMLHDGKKLLQIHMNGFDAVDVIVNGFPRKLIITEKYSTKEMLRKVIDEHGSLSVGDTIYYSESFWVIRKIDNENPVFDTATIEFSPSTLKWQNNMGNILEYPFIFNSDNLSNFGVDEGRVISILNDRRNVSIRSSEESKKIKVGQRFIFDDAAWKVISINRLNPLIEIILESDTIDTNRDNMELRIADYVKDNYTISVNPSSVSLNVSETLQLDAQVFNNGVKVDSPTIDYSSSDSDICTVNADGIIEALSEGIANITVSFKTVSVPVVVTVSHVQGHNYSVVITGDSVIYRMRTKTYSCTFYNNGTPIDVSGVFILTDTNGNPTSTAVITNQSNNTCTVRGDSLGHVILHVSDPTGTIKSEKSLQIKSAL